MAIADEVNSQLSQGLMIMGTSIRSASRRRYGEAQGCCAIPACGLRFSRHFLSPSARAGIKNSSMATATLQVDEIEAAALLRKRDWKPRANQWAIALTVTLATFMEVLDSSIAMWRCRISGDR